MTFSSTPDCLPVPPARPTPLASRRARGPLQWKTLRATDALDRGHRDQQKSGLAAPRDSGRMPWNAHDSLPPASPASSMNCRSLMQAGLLLSDTHRLGGECRGTSSKPERPVEHKSIRVFRVTAQSPPPVPPAHAPRGLLRIWGRRILGRRRGHAHHRRAGRSGGPGLKRENAGWNWVLPGSGQEASRRSGQRLAGVSDWRWALEPGRSSWFSIAA